MAERRLARQTPPAFLRRWWFALSALALILASDFKVRVRPPEEAIAGGVDLAIVIEILVYGLVAAHLATFASMPRIRRVRPQVYLASFYVFILVLSVAHAAYFEYAAIRAIQMCILLALVVSAANRTDRRQMHGFAHGYLLLVNGAVLYGAAFPSPPVSSQAAGRFAWLAVHPTVSGAMTGLATVIVAGYVLSHRRERPGPQWSRAAYLTSGAVSLGGLLASQTRGAVFAAVASIALALVLRTNGREVIAAVVGLGLVAAGAALAVSEQITAYFARGGTTEEIASLNSRTDLWAVALETAWRQPLYGFGVGASRGIFVDEIGLGGGHNAIVNVLVDAGVVGLIAWAGLVLVIVLGAKRLPRAGGGGTAVDRTLILSVVSFLLLNGIFYEGAGSVANFAVTWLFVCVAWLALAEREVGVEPAAERGVLPDRTRVGR